MAVISDVRAREILDSRGHPTIEVEGFCSDGSWGRSSIPSGASVGQFEALEKRDNDPARFKGLGVLNAVKNVNEVIAPKIRNLNPIDQRQIDETLIYKTLTIKESAFAPYSNFKVGALLVTGDDRTFSGCNIEVSSYGLTMCAERVAVFKAYSEGERKFKAIYIAADSEKYCTPCGACRQVLWDLTGNISVIMINNKGDYRSEMLADLLPQAFDKNHFEEL